MNYQDSPLEKYLYNTRMKGGDGSSSDDTSSDNDEASFNLHGGYPIQSIFGHKEDGLSKFTNLLIPAGLVIEQKRQDKVYEATDGGCISDKMFDDLFGLVNEIKSNRKRGFTKKAHKIIKVATKKRK